MSEYDQPEPERGREVEVSEEADESAVPVREPQFCEEQELFRASDPIDDMPEHQPDVQPALRILTRGRHPPMMFTYPSLGQSSFQPQTSVSAVEAQSRMHSHPHSIQPTPHPVLSILHFLQDTSVRPTPHAIQPTPCSAQSTSYAV